MSHERSDKDKNAGPNGSKKPSPAEKPRQSGSKSRTDIPVVGLGASAGGLEALKAFFAKVSDRSGLAYIVLMHLPPHQPSMLPELIQKVASIPVSMAEDGQSVLPDHILVVPPNKEASIYNGTLQLLEPADRNVSLPIDYFFRTLAVDEQSRAAAVILSGTGSDGTVGLKEVKNYEGLVLVQSTETARYDGMPGSALATGLVDMALAPEDMPRTLGDYFDQRDHGPARQQAAEEDKVLLHKIFALLRVQIGQDFSFYKPNTIGGAPGPAAAHRVFHRQAGRSLVG
jgi:two-component system CheB/CheR fusion protein